MLRCCQSIFCSLREDQSFTANVEGLPDVKHAVVIHPPLPTHRNLDSWKTSFLVSSVTLFASIHFLCLLGALQRYQQYDDILLVQSMVAFKTGAAEHSFPGLQNTSGSFGSVWNQVLELCHRENVSHYNLH